jgi:hypothetical protein
MRKTLILFLVGLFGFSFMAGCSETTLVGSTWINQGNDSSFSFTNESLVVVTISGSAIPATYSVVDETITITAMLDSIIGKIDGNKITITGELLKGEVFMKK